MSRAYRIAVSETLRRHVKVEAGVQTQLELLHVLAAERMREILAAELAELGFERDGQVCRRVDEDGVEVTVDLDAGTVTVKLAAEEELDMTARESAASTRAANPELEEQLRQRAQERLERRADARTERMREEVTATLEKKLRDLRAELDGAVNRATGAALKEKAAELGEIEEITEDDETGSLTIRVRV